MTDNVPAVVVTSSKDVTSTWSREIELKYDGQNYVVVLKWSEDDGFHTFWSDKNKNGIEDPEWAPSDDDLLQMATDWESQA